MSQKIKVIELLNKIAKGEEVSECVRYFHRMSRQYETMLVCQENIIDKLDRGIIDLNDGLEIIEEEPEIDIQNLEDIKPDTISGNQYITDAKTIIINKLIKAVKQLDNKINNK